MPGGRPETPQANHPRDGSTIEVKQPPEAVTVTLTLIEQCFPSSLGNGDTPEDITLEYGHWFIVIHKCRSL